MASYSNDTFAGDEVTVGWRAVQESRAVAGEEKTVRIPLGDHTTLAIGFTPPAAGALQLELTARKDGRTVFADCRRFAVE